ncbi:hypothetical protein KP79_PYT17820 [Mizuhopecten yessoensis]|uniref:Uncharacterized protein n=1 Tax=Mizuhopecten yessoensis TaxID=6573 RepID=A0A210Q5E3_MIZYE|nr:hypothetical protein KP79_PYT17820 [Mizuhopecten yessoensis]
MVKDMCKECGGVSPERCCTRKDGPQRHQFSLLPAPKDHRAAPEATPPARRSDLPTQVPVRNPWGPVLQSRSNFLEMHLC